MSTDPTIPMAAPVPLTGLPRWLSRWWPSHRIANDPLATLRVSDRYAPVAIGNWKLTPAMRRIVLSRRVQQPLTFESNRQLTVIIPFRDREAHLSELLPKLTATLNEQSIPHRILVVEQEPGKPFNRGKLINIGMRHVADSSDYYCIHDADAIPIVADYRCPSQPLRLVHKIIATQGETQRDAHYFSGAVSVRKEQAFAVNGFSNEYWGWGKEDDDFFFRLLLAGYLCFFDTQGVFHDLPNPNHQPGRESAGRSAHTKRNRVRRSLLVRGQMDIAADGLSTLQYSLGAAVKSDLYEKITVRI